MIFKYIKCICWPGKGWRIQWKIEDHDPTSVIVIYRSESPTGPWLELTRLASNEVTYTDLNAEYKGFFDPIWYKITVFNAAVDTILFESRPFNTQNFIDRPNAEIIRQHNLLIYGVNGNPGFYGTSMACYKKQKYGQEFCETRGYNGEITIGWSNLDQNTGKQAGYANPIIFKGRWLSRTDKQQVTTTTGRKEEFEKQLWISNYPVLEPGDILCEQGTGRNFEVSSLSASEPNGILISQTVSVSQIDLHLWEARNLYFPGEEP